MKRDYPRLEESLMEQQLLSRGDIPGPHEWPEGRSALLTIPIHPSIHSFANKYLLRSLCSMLDTVLGTTGAEGREPKEVPDFIGLTF